MLRNLTHRIRTRYLCWRGHHHWVVYAGSEQVHCFDCGAPLD